MSDEKKIPITPRNDEERKAGFGEIIERRLEEAINQQSEPSKWMKHRNYITFAGKVDHQGHHFRDMQLHQEVPNELPQGPTVIRDEEKQFEEIKLEFFTKGPDGKRQVTSIVCGLPLNCGDFASAAAMKGLIVFFREKIFLSEQVSKQNMELLGKAEVQLKKFEKVLEALRERSGNNRGPGGQGDRGSFAIPQHDANRSIQETTRKFSALAGTSPLPNPTGKPSKV